MPIEMKYVDDGLGVLYVGTGILTGKEIIEADQEQLSNHDMLKKKKYFLGDFSKIENVKISTEEIREIVLLDKKMESIVETNLVAIVASKDLVFGLSRMWEAYVDEIDWQTHVFRTRSEAEDWLRTNAKSMLNLDITIQLRGT